MVATLETSDRSNVSNSPSTTSRKKMDNEVCNNKNLNESPKPSDDVTNERRIQFNPTVRIRLTTHINDFSDQEILDSWFTDQEIQEYRNDLFEEIYAIEDGEIDMQRGLEGHTYEGKLKRQVKGMQAVLSVLEEQQYQHSIGAADPDVIAMMYKEASIQALKDARELAQQDVENAQYSFKQKYTDPMTALRAKRYRSALQSKC